MPNDTLLELLHLKALPRAGWVRAGVAEPESVASHAWGVAWLVLLWCPPEVDRDRAMAMAIVHDLGEVRVGDITPHDGVAAADKSAAEEAAVRGLLAPLQRPDLVDIWLEYEAGETACARFVKACDKLDMALQAIRYGTLQGLELQEFIDSARRQATEHGFGALFEELVG